LLEDLDLCCAELGWIRPVQVLESDEVATPATVGWRRAVVYLPGDWRGWTVAERRAVLAHEVAHVASRDYGALLWSQVCLALHVWNPMAHWLAGRLRLQQELAADLRASRLCGGSQPYAVTLAGMALRYDQRPMAGPARAFLPNRDTFVRRIQMLRDRRSLEPMTARRRGVRLAAWGVLGAVAIAAAGLRGPGASALAQSPATPAVVSAPTPERPPTPEELLALVPDSAGLAVVARPSALLADPKVAELFGRGEFAFFTLNKPVGFTAKDLRTVVLSWADGPPLEGGSPRSGEPPSLVLLQAHRPIDWTPLIQLTLPEAVEARFAGQTYLRSPATRWPGSAVRMDDRTLALGDEWAVQRYLTQPRRPRRGHDWDDLARRLPADAPVVVLGTGAGLASWLGADRPGPEAMKVQLALFAPLWERAYAQAVSLELSQGIRLQVLTASADEADAKQVAATLQALVTLGRNALGPIKQSLARSEPPGAPTAAFTSLTGTLLPLADQMLAGMTIAQEGPVVSLKTAADTDPADLLLKALLPAADAAREAARRTQGMNNLKQIALAMHMYADEHGHFPPAVVLGPDGKTPHSWRVELLPFLEQQALYSQYKMDEPWDSPANRRVLETVVPVYHSPQDAQGDPSHTSYFVLTGPETVFSGAEGCTLESIKDGTSNTLLAVESKKAVPWTKPEDIAYAAGEPLPGLGGLFSQGFQAAFADGAVRFLSRSINEAVLRAVITKDGREPISDADLSASLGAGR
jgi:hypothetical protein